MIIDRRTGFIDRRTNIDRITEEQVFRQKNKYRQNNRRTNIIGVRESSLYATIYASDTQKFFRPRRGLDNKKTG